MKDLFNVVREQHGDKPSAAPYFYFTVEKIEQSDYLAMTDAAKTANVELASYGGIAPPNRLQVVFFSCTSEEARKIASVIDHKIYNEDEQPVLPESKNPTPKGFGK